MRPVIFHRKSTLSLTHVHITLQSIFSRLQRARAIIFAETSISRDVCAWNKIYCGIKKERPNIPLESLQEIYTRRIFSPHEQLERRMERITSTTEIKKKKTTMQTQSAIFMICARTRIGRMCVQRRL